MSNQTALAVQEDRADIVEAKSRVLTRFGSENEIRMLMERQAAIYGIPEEDLERPDVQASLIKATQYSVAYGYLPGIHIHMLPFKKEIEFPNPKNPNATIKKWVKTYSPDLGEKAWKDSADRLAKMQGFRYVVETEPMSQEEVQKATAEIHGQEYDPADKGCRARVLRSDHAEIYAAMNRPYEPTWSAGYWRKKARKKSRGPWESDTVPNGRTPADVAERRAYKAALMKVFSLVPLNDFEESQRLVQLQAYVETESAIVHEPSSAAALPARREPPREADGRVLFAEESAPPSGVDEGQFRQVEEPFDVQAAETAADEFNSIPGAGDYAGLIDELTGDCRTFADWCRQKHATSGGPCTQPQYRYLVGTLNGLTGQEGSHSAILEMLVGRTVDSDNPPGYDLVSNLLDWLPEEKSEVDADGKKVKVGNPTYRKEYAQCIQSIWRVIQEYLGQMELPIEE